MLTTKIVVTLPNGNKDLGRLIATAKAVTKIATERGYELRFAHPQYATDFIESYKKAGGGIKTNGNSS